MDRDALWLDRREQAAWRSFIAMHTQLFRHLERALQADAGLSGPDYEVLVHLSEAAEDELRPTELAAAIGWERSRLSHQLRRMERRGLVERRSCDSDGRGAHVALTAAGRAAIEGAAPGHVAELRRVFVDVLGADRLRDLAAMSDDVVAAIPARGADEPIRHGSGATG